MSLQALVSFHPTWTLWSHIPHFTSTLPTSVLGQTSSFSQGSNEMCQSKQEVYSKALFPAKFSGGTARLTLGIPSHWGNNWHSWDREKQTSQSMFWWSLPMRWCLWRAAGTWTSQYKCICKTPLTLALKPRVQSEWSLTVLFLLATLWKMLEALLAYFLYGKLRCNHVPHSFPFSGNLFPQ